MTLFWHQSGISYNVILNVYFATVCMLPWSITHQQWWKASPSITKNNIQCNKKKFDRICQGKQVKVHVIGTWSQAKENSLFLCAYKFDWANPILIQIYKVQNMSLRVCSTVMSDTDSYAMISRHKINYIAENVAHRATNFKKLVARLKS